MSLAFPVQCRNCFRRLPIQGKTGLRANEAANEKSLALAGDHASAVRTANLTRVFNCAFLILMSPPNLLPARIAGSLPIAVVPFFGSNTDSHEGAESRTEQRTPGEVSPLTCHFLASRSREDPNLPASLTAFTGLGFVVGFVAGHDGPRDPPGALKFPVALSASATRQTAQRWNDST